MLGSVQFAVYRSGDTRNVTLIPPWLDLGSSGTVEENEERIPNVRTQQNGRSEATGWRGERARSPARPRQEVPQAARRRREARLAREAPRGDADWCDQRLHASRDGRGAARRGAADVA